MVALKRAGLFLVCEEQRSLRPWSSRISWAGGRPGCWGGRCPGQSGEQLVELLVIADGQLEVAGDDPGLLVVPGGVAGQLEDNSSFLGPPANRCRHKKRAEC